MNPFVKTPLALAVAATVFASGAACADPPPAKFNAAVTLQPAGSGPNNSIHGVAVNDPARDPHLPTELLQLLLREKIKYVFVIFNENHSFDNEFGTFPGVNGLYSDGTRARSWASNTQSYTDVNGNAVTVRPFLIGPAQNANVVDSVDHSHTGLAKKIDVQNSVAQMDHFALDEYSRFAPNNSASTANQKKGTQFARLVMSHIDCDTIPFFWKWASNFTIFDNIYATEDTPSTPNAVAMIAGQSGETQWVKHPSQTSNPTATGSASSMNGTFIQGAGSVTYTGQTGTTQGPPLVNDPQPWYGSQFDATATLSGSGIVSGDRQPYGPNESYGATNIASNLTFATVPLTLLGNRVASVMATNRNPGFDTPDIQQDIPYIQKHGDRPVDWRWYQNGYGLESTDTGGMASHAAYVSHHQGPQYFGYLANTPSEAAKLKGETDFFTDIANHKLPHGGVFYIRGGYKSQQGLTPWVSGGTSNPAYNAIVAAKSGDDDHPSYSDRQLTEAMAARVVNAIADNREIWEHSAIIITYDESDGFYDHMPPRILSYGPDSLPLSRGVRVPLILISPYARTHAVSHVEGDHNAVIETINAIFNLPALASLPDEAQALKAGNSAYFNQFAPAGFQQHYLGPRDINSPITESLLSGFDPRRLLGLSAPLPPEIAKIDEATVNTLPHYNNAGCSALGITPVAEPATDTVPAGFNPLPSTYPASN
ncbi:MAG TPA: alkaline phosphatase family protein [Steroidobacteraceae bacterium]|nr:alkaline phosphatase family protein [Steroidobacteraceae bacterium]